MLPLLLACASPSPDTSVMGEGWFASAEPSPGDTVHLWADFNPFNTLVDGWDGVDLAEWNGEVQWPEGAVSPHKVDLALSPEITALEGRTTTIWDPGGTPVGTLLFFHGAAYDETMLQWLPAGQHLVRQAIHRGWRVVAPASSAAESAGVGGWSSTDLEVALAIAAAQPAPVVAMGMSSGGQFAHEVGEAAPTAAVVAFCAPGSADTLARTSTPTGWYLAERDSVFSSGVDDATAASLDLDARGVPWDLVVHPATPLYDARFTRVDGISADQSAEIAQTLRDEGWYDGGWTTSGGAVDIEADPAVLAEIEIMAADHELYDDALVGMFSWVAEVTGVGG